jgi:hypothetical protein
VEGGVRFKHPREMCEALLTMCESRGSLSESQVDLLVFNWGIPLLGVRFAVEESRHQSK